MKVVRSFVLFVFLCTQPCLIAKAPDDIPPSKESEEEITPVKEGNLKLSSSQLPGPLFGFGQNSFDKGITLAYAYGTSARGQHSKFNDLFLSVVRQMTDKFSLLVGIPIATEFKENCACSSGIEDIAIQGEYLFFSKDTLNAYNFATAVGAIILPTGSDIKDPATGNGSASFFTGLTMVHLAVDWYVYSSLGVVITTPHRGSKSGDDLLYQCGVGHNIKTNSKWICAWLVEFLGDYTGKDIVDCQIDCESGSNVVSIAPSLWFSTERLVAQIGIAVPVIQHLPLLSYKERFTVSGGLGWKF